MLTEQHKKELEQAIIFLGSNYQVMISADLLRAIQFELSKLQAFENGSTGILPIESIVYQTVFLHEKRYTAGTED